MTSRLAPLTFLGWILPTAAVLLVDCAKAQPGSVDTLQRAFAGGGGGRRVDFTEKRSALRQAVAGNARALIALTAPGPEKPTADDYGTLVQHASALLIAGRRDAALQAARQAEGLLPEVWKEMYYPPFVRGLVDVYVHAGSGAEAVRVLRKVLAKFSTDNTPEAMLADLLATSPEAKLRNGKEALALATKANRAANFRDLRCASAYAAAAAECGQFDEAIRRQTVIAGKSRDGRDWTAEEVSEAKERLAAYQARKPWRLRVTPTALFPWLRTLAGD